MSLVRTRLKPLEKENKMSLQRPLNTPIKQGPVVKTPNSTNHELTLLRVKMKKRNETYRVNLGLELQGTRSNFEIGGHH